MKLNDFDNFPLALVKNLKRLELSPLDFTILYFVYVFYNKNEQNTFQDSCDTEYILKHIDITPKTLEDALYELCDKHFINLTPLHEDTFVLNLHEDFITLLKDAMSLETIKNLNLSVKNKIELTLGFELNESDIELLENCLSETNNDEVFVIKCFIDSYVNKKEINHKFINENIELRVDNNITLNNINLDL